MNIVASESHFNNGESFVISEYLDFLTVSEKDKSKYICPVCEGHNFSIKKDGIVWNCFSDDSREHRKDITTKLKKLNGESDKPVISNNKDPLQVYKLDTAKVQEKVKKKKNKLSTSMAVLDFLKDKYDKRIRYNVRYKEIEIDDMPISLDCIRAEIGDKHQVDIASTLLIECFLYLALKNQYDPVKDYLLRCKRNGTILDINGLAHGLFGTSNRLHDVYFRKWLIACVARVFEPGCKFDEALILQGKQESYKSTFFRVMGSGFFTDSMTNKLDKDDLLLLGRNWIVEWGELDGFTAKIYHGHIKHFLSKQDDFFRVPYGKDTQRVPRRTVIVGSTNRDDFLSDPTGNRRFWIIPVTKEIPLDTVKDMVEDLWATAVTLYESGEDWRLPRELRAMQADDNQNYELTDPWEEILLPYLETQEAIHVTVIELFKKLEAEGINLTRSKGDQMRLADLLRRSGWERVRKLLGDKQKRVWVKIQP